MPIKINVEGTTALVLVEVDLQEWGGKYPDDHGVLDAAVIEIRKSIAAIMIPPASIDAQIAALEKQKADSNELKPVVVLAPDVVKVEDATAAAIEAKPKLN